MGRLDWDLYDPTGNPPTRLHDWLDLHVINYESALRAFWGLEDDVCPEHLDFESWQDAKKLDASFDSLFGSIQELSLNPKIHRHLTPIGTPDQALTELPLLFVNAFVGDRIQLSMAYSALHKWTEATKRARFLILLLGKRRLNEVAQGYMRRAAELFLWGFDIEAMVMASCALEEALRRELEDVPLEQYGFTRQPRQHDWDYWQLIQGAGAIGVFTPAQAKQADEIRLLRNQLLHDIPETQEKAGQVLLTLTQLLAALIPARGHLLADGPGR